jgi:hypothetical protein
MKPLTVVFLVLLGSALLVLLGLLNVADALPHWGRWWQITLCLLQAVFWLYMAGLIICLLWAIAYTVWSAILAVGRMMWVRLRH